jgi:hypothetical protein
MVYHRIKVTMRLWRNWQTRYLQAVVLRYVGSNPISRTTLLG